MFDPMDFPGAVIPTTWWNPGVNLIWIKRLSRKYRSARLNVTSEIAVSVVYQDHGLDTISIVPAISGRAQLYSANLDVAKQVVAGGVKSPWTKPERVSQGLL